MSEKAGVSIIGKEYLGDGAYVAFDGYALVLTTENGIEVTNAVVLEPDVYAALLTYVERMKALRVGDVLLPDTLT